MNTAIFYGSPRDDEELMVSFRPSTLARRAAQRQFDAYNRGDIDAFAAAYSDDVVFIDKETEQVLCSGKAELIEKYGKLFAENPSLRCELISRTSTGSFVYDEERVTGHPIGKIVHAMATYHVNDEGLIDRVWITKEIEEAI